MSKLIVTLPDGTQTTHELTEPEITIGRTDENTLQIDDISVSSHHAVLALSGDDYILTDIGSTNGTRINGRDIDPETEHTLKPGDTVRFGKVETVYAPDSEGDTKPMPEGATASVVVGSTSSRPSNFTNASPFQKKGEKRDPAATAILVFGFVAIAAFLGAVAMILGMKSPL
jgi:predicted component of type VI protein secretion system